MVGGLPAAPYVRKQPITLETISNWLLMATELEKVYGHSIPIPPLKSVSQLINSHVALVEADIARLEVDVIVNAANSKMTKGTGVCEAVFAGAGWLLVEQ